jgi:Tfp pilus assembly protein PilF
MAHRKRTNLTAPAAADSPRRWKKVAPAAALMLLGFLLYAPALGGEFIWDDARAITDNLDLRSAHGLADIWAGAHDADYLPLKSSFLWVIYQLFGAAPPAYHVFNVAMHGLCAVLLWQVLRRLKIAGAWLAALVFLIHPTHVESVAWVSECKNTLSSTFGLLAVLAWLRYQDQRGVRAYLSSLLLFVCALLCKAHLVILPVVLVVLYAWQLPERFARRAFVRAVAPFFLVAALFSVVTVRFQNARAIAEFQIPIGGPASRIANAGKAAWWYLGKAVSPVHVWYEMPGRPIETTPEALAVLAGTRAANPAPAWPQGNLVAWPLCAIYRQWRVTTPVWYDYLPALAMVALLVQLARKRRGPGRGAFFGFSYFIVALVPVLGLVKMSYMRAAWVADHLQYLADIGLIVLACAAGVSLFGRLSSTGRRILVGATTVLLVSYAAMTFARAATFATEHALWTDTVGKNRFAWQAHARLGAALMAKQKFAAAADHFSQELRLTVNNPEAHNNLGLALVSQGKLPEGIEQLRLFLRLDDKQFFAHANLADALASQKQWTEAASEYRQAIRRNPSLAPLHFRLGAALAELGSLDEAIASFEKADALVPGNSEIRAALAAARQKRAASLP